MNLVDTSGWLEFYTDGSNASIFENVLWTQDAHFKNLEQVKFFPKNK